MAATAEQTATAPENGTHLSPLACGTFESVYYNNWLNVALLLSHCCSLTTNAKTETCCSWHNFNVAIWAHPNDPKRSQEYNTCNKHFAWFHQFRTSRMRLKAHRAWPAFNVQTAWHSLRASYITIWRKSREKSKYGQGMPRVFAILAGEANDAILGFWVHLPRESDSLALESCHVA